MHSIWIRGELIARTNQSLSNSSHFDTPCPLISIGQLERDTTSPASKKFVCFLGPKYFPHYELHVSLIDSDSEQTRSTRRRSSIVGEAVFQFVMQSAHPECRYFEDLLLGQRLFSLSNISYVKRHSNFLYAPIIVAPSRVAFPVEFALESRSGQKLVELLIYSVVVPIAMYLVKHDHYRKMKSRSGRVHEMLAPQLRLPWPIKAFFLAFTKKPWEKLIHALSTGAELNPWRNTVPAVGVNPPPGFNREYLEEQLGFKEDLDRIIREGEQDRTEFLKYVGFTIAVLLWAAKELVPPIQPMVLEVARYLLLHHAEVFFFFLELLLILRAVCVAAIGVLC